MDNDAFSSIDDILLSSSDSDMIRKLTESSVNSTDGAAIQAALGMLFKQRNMLAYKVNELLDPAITVQSELFRKAANLRIQLDQANASVELQYSDSLARDEMRRQFISANDSALK